MRNTFSPEFHHSHFTDEELRLRIGGDQPKASKLVTPQSQGLRSALSNPPNLWLLLLPDLRELSKGSTPRQGQERWRPPSPAPVATAQLIPRGRA